MAEKIYSVLADELDIKLWQVEATVKLIDEGNTIPFIARYRKDVTGSLNDEVLRKFDERLTYLRNLEARKEQIISSIEEQGKLTEDLRNAINKQTTMVSLEDLYLPYRPKRRTRAIIAKERDLEPLSKELFSSDFKLSDADKYINIEKEVLSREDAINGASDIIAENISDNATYRDYIRKYTFNNGNITSAAKDKEKDSVYEMYYDFTEPVKKIAGHRILAINRGEKEKFLTVKVEVDESAILAYLEKQLIKGLSSDGENVIKSSIADSYKRLIAPAIERDIRNDLTETAEDGAIMIFGKNLHPGFRTGCKIAVVDETGKVLETTVVYPTEPQNKIAETKKTILKLIDKYNVTLISLGNGTASRESEKVVVDIIKEAKHKVSYVIVNEAGASVYSASKLATEEFPNLDVGGRSSASMARRLQDPLAELVKIDPKSIGVGQYQHDMNQKKLNESLTGVVEDCVNSVGVDLNTASASLLEYISGISKTIAKNIVKYREENGRFKNRKELLKVDKLGPKAFLQCAGFLRIMDGDNPLDHTSVHPESYDAVSKLLSTYKLVLDNDKNKTVVGLRLMIKDYKKTAEELSIGEITLKDIVDELEKPGRDPRDEMPKPILKTDVLELSDLKPGMILKGTVRNVIDFGAFVDIGVHQDGLVHISQISDRYIKHPLEAVSVGDIVDVQVMNVDPVKKRIQLTMKIKK